MPNKPPTRQTTPKRKAWEQRTDARKRGYTWDWEQFSRNYRANYPLCEMCESCNVVRPSVSVHHIQKIDDAPERKLDITNVIALCDECHKRADRDAAYNARCKRLADERHNDSLP